MKPTHIFVVATLGLTGCADNYWTSTVSRTKSLSDDQVLLTTADLRAVSRSPRNGSSVFCVEPSPDVAKIANASFSGDLGLSAESIGSFASPELAIALAAARAEGLAQLGQRLATIQLLRDGLYRACEAYANKAIGKENYAMILSRYDDIMVTMLLAEFGAQAAQTSPLARLVGSGFASGTALVGPGLGADVAMKDLLETQKRLSEKSIEIANAEADLGKIDKSAKSGEWTKKNEAVQKLKREEDAVKKEIERKGKLLDRTQAAQVNSFVSVGTQSADAKGNGQPSDAAAIAAAMVMMQQAYLDDFNLDSIMAGCLTALAKEDGGPRETVGYQSALAEACEAYIGGGVLDTMATIKAFEVLHKGGESPGQNLRHLQELARELKKMVPSEGQTKTQQTGATSLASGQAQ